MKLFVIEGDCDIAVIIVHKLWLYCVYCRDNVTTLCSFERD